MNSKNIEALHLNIGDVLEIFLIDFFYKSTQIPGKKIKTLEIGYDKKGQKGQKGWKACSKITGAYCGDNYRQQPYELNIIKIRLHTPIRMSDTYQSYIEFTPVRIASIKVTKKAEEKVLDTPSHALTASKVA